MYDMGRYARNSPFNNILIRQMAGSAVYAEAAIKSGGIWNPDRLEEFLYRARTDWSKTNCIRKMFSKHAPLESNCKLIDKSISKYGTSAAGCSSLFWRNLPLWWLIDTPKPDDKSIARATESARHIVQSFIESYEPDSYPPNHLVMEQVRSDRYEYTASYENLAALTALTAWARQDRENPEQKFGALAVAYTYSIFPVVVTSNPQLYIRWPTLLNLYSENIWKSPNSWILSSWPKLDTERLIKCVEWQALIAKKADISLPPISVVSSINQSQLKKQYYQKSILYRHDC